MTKDDKAKIATAWRSYNIAASMCANVLYNLAQSETKQETKSKYGQLVREHDAARNSLHRVLQQHGIKE